MALTELKDNVDLDLEEVEGLIRSGGASGVGSGSKRSSLNSSYCDQCLASVCDNRRRAGCLVAVCFLLLVVVNVWGGGASDTTSTTSSSNGNQGFVIIDPDSPTSSPSGATITIIDATPKEDQGEQIVIVEATDPPKQPDPPTDVPQATDAPAPTDAPKPKPRNPNIPLLEPDYESGPIPEEKRAALEQKWGAWHFWDGDSDIRPKDYLSKYPLMDIPGDDFPQNSWQTDAVYVNHYLNDAGMLIDRAMEAIFTEYGHGKPLPPEEMAARMKMFHWEKINMAEQKDVPEPFQRKGARDIGGWTTKRSFDGLVRRLLHAMMTQDTFTVVLAGHSAAQGQGNHFRQSYMMQFHRIMKPIFQRLGVKLITRNMAQGGLGTLQGGMGAKHIYGDEIDMFLWDSGMTEGGSPEFIDLVCRQVLLSGKRVPVIWGPPFELLKMYHEDADVDVGEWGNGYAGIPETTSEEQSETLPYAARNMKCSSERGDLCNDNRYSSVCWLNRTDGLPPGTNQLVRPRGQVKWHPGWRPHQLMGRVLAYSVMEALEVAINRWMEGTMTGQPLDDDFWHVKEYYETIREKVRKLDPSKGRCYDISNVLPSRMCHTPMNARTQYTPRADWAGASITSILKPSAATGYVPKNDEPPYYEGPDAHNPAYDVPEGAVDVLSIVMGRRRRQLLRESLQQRSLQEDNATTTSETIVPGDGWEIALEPQGQCDGTYEAICAHSKNEECFLMGHPDGRGAIVGCEWSGWLVMTLENVQEGLIILKLQTWHTENENPKTRSWTSVNNGKRRRRLADHDNKTTTNKNREDDAIYYMGDLAYPEWQTINDTDIFGMSSDSSSSSQSRELRMRSYATPELPDSFYFDYAINGKITSLNNTEFLAAKKDPARVVEFVTILDDEKFAEKGDVEVAIRLRGIGRTMFFGVSHVYWA